MKSNPYKNKKYSFSVKEKKKRNPLSAFSFSRIFQRKPKIKMHRYGKTAEADLFQSKEIYVETPGRKSRPAWFIPVVMILGISMVVFWIGPLVLNTIVDTIFQKKETGGQKNLIYTSDNYAVVSKQVTDVLETPDLKSARKTQALYNQVVKITNRSTYGYYGVELEDKTTGYIRSSNLVFYTTSVEPALYQYKIIVTSGSKKIMTHSSNGSVILEALMGTTLYSSYQGDGVYKVALPDGSDGWIGANGVIKLKSGDEIKKSSAKNFYSTVLSFNGTMSIDGGMTKNGASSEGITYIAAKVNGVTLPRDVQGQSKTGAEVKPKYDGETGALKYDSIQEGDLIFFKSEQDPSKAGEMGIVVGYGQVLMSRNSKASIRIINLDNDTNLASSVLTIRRIF